MTETAKKPGSARKRGRPPGTHPKGLATRERARALAQAEVKPLAVLLETMAERWNGAKAAKTPKTRAKLQNEACAVAEKVAPYLHPKLQATTLKGDGENLVSFVLNLPDCEELRKAIRGN